MSGQDGESEHDSHGSSQREFLVVGPPGTGKSTYLSKQARNAVEKRGGSSVVIASLTKAAAVEIAGKVEAALAGRVPIARENVGTLHSLCMHGAGLAGRLVLDSPKGFSAWNDWVRKRPEFKLTGGNDPDDPMAGSKDPTRGTVALERLMLNRHRMVPFELWAPEVQEFGHLWSQAMEELEATDFTQMIEYGLDMEAPPGNPEVLLVDERQDLSKLEGAVVRRWSQGVEVCVEVGDPDQTIYAWRGADPDWIAGRPVHTVLEQSYRVPAKVHALAQRVIRKIRNRTDYAYHPTAEEGRVDIREDCSWRRPEWWVDSMLRDSEDGGVMVLASCAFLLQPLISWLKDAGIPFHNPYRRRRGDWNPLGNQDAEKRTAANQLLAYLGGDENGWHVEQLKAWLPLLRGAKHKIPLMDDDAYLRWGVRAGLQKAQGAFLTPGEYLDLFQEPEVGLRSLQREIGWLQEGMDQKNRDRLKFPLAVVRKLGSDGLRIEPRITVGTIHSVKGGEARHVYVLTALPRQWSEQGGDDLARLFYVAVTRARQSCTVLCGDQGGYEF